MFGIIGDLTKAVVGAVAARRKPAVTPIATAPRDGTTFIGYLNGMVWTTYAGRYYEKWPHEQGGPTFRIVWTRYEGESLVPYNPTHWMPLPTMPNAALTNPPDTELKRNYETATGRRVCVE